MNKRAPSPFALVTMVAFTAAAVGLLLFLWISFGGGTPFASQGYRFSVEFDQATELGSDAQVQISGVDVGRVISVGLDRRTGLSRALVEIDKQYVPRPADTRAILRTKSLLGETYVQLSPGSPTAPKLRDGATIPPAQVQSTVQLDQIFNAFDPGTRHAFQTWLQQGGIALSNRGQQFNAALADLYPFAVNVDSVLAVLHRQGEATSTLLRDGGQVFSALARSPQTLQSFVRNSNSVFQATANRNAALAATFQAFPAFLSEARSTVNRITRFSTTTKPLIDELRPAAVQLTPALQAIEVLAPELRTLMVNVKPLTQASKAGFPALQDFLNRSVPFLTRAKPYLGGLVPVLNYLNTYRRELSAFFANSTATTQGTFSGGKHYLRISNPINPEALTSYQARPSSNRANAYLVPGGYSKLIAGLPVFTGNLCTSNALPTLAPSLSNTTTSVAGNVLTIAQLVQKYYYTSDPSGPPCAAQQPLGSVTTGQAQSFPSLQPLP